MNQKQENELEAYVDPVSMTVAVAPGELVVMPVDCEPAKFVEAIKEVPGIEAWPLPDQRVAVKRST